MPVRKTESRLPSGFTATDLGRVVTATANTNIHLISYLPDQVVKERMQHYVVIVADAALAPTIGQYAWSINNAGTTTTQNTDAGILEFTPGILGPLEVTVAVKNTGGTTVATMTMQQVVGLPFEPLEQRIDHDESTTPGAAHPETSREVINDLRRFADVLTVPTGDELLGKLMLSICYSVTLRIPQSSQVVRNTRLENAAREINNGNHTNFLSVTENGIGVCEVKPHILAMCLNKTGTTPYIPFTQIPASGGARRIALTTIRTAFNALPETDKIDLFNLLRFPRTHFRMCKVVLERLRDEFFVGQTMQTVLATNANIERLLTAYQENAIRARIRGMMSNPIWAFVPPLPAGAGGPPPVPSPGTAPNIGSFEKIPQQTFIATATPTDNGFIPSAFAYHETYGLNPQTVPSMEDILSRLSAQTTHLDRIRIVSHFSLEENNFISAIMIPFFNGQTLRQTEWWHFKFGISKEAGLQAFFEDRVPRNYQHICNFDVPDDPARPTHRAPLWQAVLKAIRSGGNSGVLTPLGMGSNNPSGNILTFVRFSCDLFVLNNITLQVEDNLGGNNQPLPQSSKDVRVAFIESEITRLTGLIKTATRTVTQIGAVKTAIVNLTTAQLPVPQPSPMTSLAFQVPDALMLTPHPTLIANLNTVKARFNGSSFVDIRGCRVGQDARYMNAVRDFFSPSATVKLTVTAPEWFQSYSPLGFIHETVSGGTPDQQRTGRETVLRSNFTGGASGLSGADVQREYSNWSGRIGIPAHIAFWQRLTAPTNDPLEFLEFAWKNQLPALSMDPVRLRNFSTLAYPAAVAMLGDIFNLLSTQIPAPADLTTFTTSLLPHIPALRNADRTIAALTASSPQGDLNTANTALQAVATSMAQALPAAPSPVTLTYLQTSIGTLKTHATTHPNITPFLTAIQTKVTAPAAGFLYMMFCGLPLMAQQSPPRERNVIFFTSQALREDMLRSFMRIHWADPLPAGSQVNTLTPIFGGPTSTGSGTGLTITDLGRMLQVAELSPDRASAQLATNPNHEYHQHIISLP